MTQGIYRSLLPDGLWSYKGLSLTILGNGFKYKIYEKLISEKSLSSMITQPTEMCDERNDGRFIDEIIIPPLEVVDITLLEGTWTQKGNLIILHDEYTNHDFYLIYEYPNLRTMLLPGDRSIDGTVLTPQ